MDLKRIERYMERNGVNEKERVSKIGGGQYLKYFLVEFAAEVKKETLDNVIGEVRKLRDK